MVYGTRPGGGGHTITTFWPDDTADTMYLMESEGLARILEVAEEKWPGITPEEITISPERIHTDCIHYDLYDPSDYTNFLRIEASAEYMERATKPAAATV